MGRGSYLGGSTIIQFPVFDSSKIKKKKVGTPKKKKPTAAKKGSVKYSWFLFTVAYAELGKMDFPKARERSEESPSPSEVAEYGDVVQWAHAQKEYKKIKKTAKNRAKRRDKLPISS